MSKRASSTGLLAAAVLGYLGYRWWSSRNAPALAESTAKPQLVMTPGAPITLTTQGQTQDMDPTTLIRQTISTKNFVDPALLAFTLVPAVERASTEDVLKLLHAEGR